MHLLYIRFRISINLSWKMLWPASIIQEHLSGGRKPHHNGEIVALARAEEKHLKISFVPSADASILERCIRLLVNEGVDVRRRNDGASIRSRSHLHV